MALNSPLHGDIIYQEEVYKMATLNEQLANVQVERPGEYFDVPALDKDLAGKEWADQRPRMIMLNIRVTENKMRHLTGLGIELQYRSQEEQAGLNQQRIQEGKDLGIETRRYQRVDKAGYQQVDTGIKTEIKRNDGLVCFDRIWYDLQHRLRMVMTGVWLVKKDSNTDFMYFLKIRFEAFRDESPTVLCPFLLSHVEEGVDYYLKFPERADRMLPRQAAEADRDDLIALLDEILQRPYQFCYLFRNPNRSWTLNTGHAHTGKLPETYFRLRIPNEKLKLEKVTAPKFRESSINPRPRNTRTAVQSR